MTRVPSFDEAAATGVALSAMTSDMPCWIGDFVNFCEATFGEKFSQILSLFPEGKYQTVANYTSVCKRVKPHVRRKELFFSHYDAVAKLDESKQIHWLKVAVDEGLSSRALRAAIAKSLRPVEPTKKDEAEKDDEDILIEAMKVALRNTRKAADLILTVDPKAGPAQAELKEAEHKLEGALWHFGVEVER